MSDSTRRVPRGGGTRGPSRHPGEPAGDRDGERPQRAVDDEQQRALRRLDRVARLLDSCVRVPFTPLRFGIDGAVGLVPVVGDAAAAALSLYPVVEARRLGFRAPTILRMLGNVALDAVVGAIPVVGDLFDFGFKANQRNVELLRARLRENSSKGVRRQ